MEFDKRLIPNYMFAGATLGVFLYGIVLILHDPATYITGVVNVVEGMEPVAAAGVAGIGGILIGVFATNVEKVYNFFFKKTPTTT